MMIELSPDVVTVGSALKSSSGDPPISSRRVSAVSWPETLEDRLSIRYWVPPVNSMPKFRPLTTTTRIARPTRAPEMEYQSARWPTKS